jgi:hypothetical protein
MKIMFWIRLPGWLIFLGLAVWIVITIALGTGWVLWKIGEVTFYCIRHFHAAPVPVPVPDAAHAD